MHHKRDGGNHHEHHGGNGVEQEAQMHYQFVGKGKPLYIEYSVDLTNAVYDKVRRAAKEVCECHCIGKHGGNAHGKDAYQAGQLMAHFHSRQS